MDLTNKVAVVTGASSGLGLTFARALVARGAQVFGLSRRHEKLEAIRDELGKGFHPLPCDVTDEVQVKMAFEAVEREAGRLDILINNAGLGKFGRVEELSVDHWTVQMETNLGGVFRCTREVGLQKNSPAHASISAYLNPSTTGTTRLIRLWT